jgi:peptidyl-prolyl cis-trans isomerase SurA
VKRITIIYFLCLFVGHIAQAQPQIIDEIVAVVGDEIILYSDVQLQKNQIKAQGYSGTITDCQVLEEILFEKIMLNQAKVDSIEVSDDMVNGELQKRIAVFVRQIGSEKALEEYYGKSMEEIREEFFEALKDQLLVQRMEGEISSELNITPSDVQAFYHSIDPDSLPFISASVEMAMIAKFPKPTVEETELVRSRLRDFKQQAETGKNDFETLAVLYSDDPGSAAKGGALGMKPRGTWVPEFDAVAFGLEEGQISAPFKTDYGFHIMKMNERRGEMYDANHILIVPKIESRQLIEAKVELDSVRVLVVRDSISFAFAANKYSDDERTKNSNGAMVNPATGSTIYQMDELDPSLFLTIDTLEIGEVSQPIFFQSDNREKGYRLIMLTERTEPHRANLTDDYQTLQAMATEKFRVERMDSWIRDRIKETFIKINKDYADCSFGYPWLAGTSGTQISEK